MCPAGVALLPQAFNLLGKQCSLPVLPPNNNEMDIRPNTPVACVFLVLSRRSSVYKRRDRKEREGRMSAVLPYDHRYRRTCAGTAFRSLLVAECYTL